LNYQTNFKHAHEIRQNKAVSWSYYGLYGDLEGSLYDYKKRTVRHDDYSIPLIGGL
jgi:hypothetical protein